MAEPKPKSSQQRSRIRKVNEERIINAALPLFARSGFRGTTVDQIAQASGLSKANMLYYYRRKQDIYLAVIEHILHIWLAPLEQLQLDGDPGEQLRAYIELKLLASEQSPDASRVYATEILNGAPILLEYLNGPLKALVDDKCRVIQHWIDKGRLRAIDPMHLLFAIWSTTQHYADFKVQVDILSGQPNTVFSDAQQTLNTLLVDSLLP